MRFHIQNKKAFCFWTLVILFWIANLAYRPTLWTVIGTLGVMAALSGLFVLLTGKLRASVLFLTILGVGLWLLNAGKRVFWKDRLKFEDLTIFTDPTNFETVFHYPLECTLAGILLVGLILLCYKAFTADRSHLTLMRRVMVSAVTIVAGVASATFGLQNGQQQWMANVDKGSNVIANLLMSSKIQYTSPATIMASEEQFPGVATIDNAQKPLSDVVLILQESTMDPRRFKGVDSQSLPQLEMFDSRYATQQGALRVHTYGGGTWRSEFSALTGLSSSDFGVLAGSVFYSAVFHVQDSLWSRLKASGYKIIIVTPFAEGSYNSGKAYRHMGADEIIHVADLGWEGSNRKNVWNIPTANLLEMVRTVMDREHEGPIAVYALTMNEHGPYPSKKDHMLKASNPKVDNGQLASLAEYIDRLEKASAATVEFDKWIQERSRPTVMVRFGDHQPAINWKNGYYTTMSSPEYITDYTLVDNQVKEKEEAWPLTDIVFLPSLILERVGVPMGRFYETTSAMKSLCQGLYQDCADKQLLKAYQNEIYVNQQIAE